MKIKAYAIKKKGGKVESFLYNKNVGKNDILVKITHCSIARGDVQFIDNDWGDTKFPLVPGHEIIGTVEQTGSHVTGLRNGDRVCIGYQRGGCVECEFCKEGYERLCSKQKVVAVHSYGGWRNILLLTVDLRSSFHQNLTQQNQFPC